jgi:hypothetical protein
MNMIKLTLISILAILLVFTFHLASVQVGTPAPSPIVATLFPARDLDLLPVFSQLMTTRDENCRLPCWWGLRPGETTREQVVDFLSETGFDRSWRLSGVKMSLGEYLDNESIGLSLKANPYNSSNLIMNFIFQPRQDILDRIGLTFIRPNEWLSEEQNRISLPRIFQEIDALPEIYVERNQPTNGNLVVIYRGEGIFTIYEFEFETANGSPASSLNICLRNRNTRRIGLALAQNASSFVDLPSTSAYIPFEQAFNMSLETFVQFFREHPDECLVVSEQTEN